MTRMPKTDPIFTPELIRVMKIFGFISIGIVLVLSFFNTKRANNSGDDPTFRMADSNRLFFLNLNAINYDREYRKDAGMILYRHADREKSDIEPILDLAIILNPSKDEAYLYFEPQQMDWPIDFKIISGEQEIFYTIENGDKMAYLSYIEKLSPFLETEAKFFIKQDEDWTEIWREPSAKSALKSTQEDYFRLINQQ